MIRGNSGFVVLTFVVFGTSFASAAERPNIVFILADDHTSQTWGCYNARLSEHAVTPNIDQIAAEGALLENCFCTNSICVPSRATILTGQYSHKNGVKTLRHALAPNVDNVAKQLQSGGYQTALVGKWHLKKPPAGFDYWNIIKSQGRYHNPVMFEMDLKKPVTQKGSYCTDLFTDHALKWLDQRQSDQPFCLMLHFKATHEPWQYHQRHAHLYKDQDLPEPETLFPGTGPKNSRVPGWPLEILAQRMQKPGHGGGPLRVDSNDPETIRQATYQKLAKDVLRCVAAIDENIGRVKSYLDEHDLADNTVMIYTSDQGYFLGEHNYFDKRFMLEESLRMPFVIRYPNEIKAGSRPDDLITNVDFAQTFLDYADIDAPQSMQGRSFRKLLSGDDVEQPWRKAIYYRYFEDSKPRPSHYGIRTEDAKLIYYDGLKNQPEDLRWEFYDLKNDAHETVNAYDLPRYRETIEHLKVELTALQESVGDQP